MMPILETLGLWVLYALGVALYTLVFLLMLCVPMAAVYAVVSVLAKLIAFIRGRGPRKGGTR